MDSHRADQGTLSTGQRRWPLVVRRAAAEDREAVVEFASSTWDGWDYIPHAWNEWLEADDGVLLVGLPGSAAAGAPALDASDAPLPSDRPLAVARVALLSPTEAWLEGIRVHPRVRGMGVATDLQVAELRVAASLGTSVVRYATSSRNEGSHRLGARHGFDLVAALRSYSSEEQDDEAATGFSEEARTAATVARGRVLQQLAARGLVAPAEDGPAWWARLSAHATFGAGARLYEHRAWALQELDRQRFMQHAGRGEVIVSRGGHGPDGWALAVLPAQALPAEDVRLHLALLVGEGPASLRLASEVQRLTQGPIRFRLPEVPGLLGGLDEETCAATGFIKREWLLHILGRPLDAAHPVPPIKDPAFLIPADEPERI